MPVQVCCAGRQSTSNPCPCGIRSISHWHLYAHHSPYLVFAKSTSTHGLTPCVDLSAEREWLDPQTSLSYPLDSCCLIGKEQISNMVAVKLVEWSLKLGVLTDQLCAMLDKEPQCGTGGVLMALVNSPQILLNFFSQIMTFLLSRNLNSKRKSWLHCNHSAEMQNTVMMRSRAFGFFLMSTNTWLGLCVFKLFHL